MQLLELIDFKVILVILAAPLWLPVARLMWRAVNPYPKSLVPRSERARAPEGPQLDGELESEEWAVWRLRRELEKAGETLPPIDRQSATPRLQRMSSGEVHAKAGLRRSA